MIKSPLSDRIFLFVCYESGSGGENLSTKISKLEPCMPLEFYTTEQGRTIITSDFFEKVFLYSGASFDTLLQKAQNLLQSKTLVQDKILVCPSHWDFDVLLPYFPNGKFVRIVHDDLELVEQNRINKIHNSKFSNFLEFTGFCLSYVEQDTLGELLKQKKITFDMQIGEILAVLNDYRIGSTESRFKHNIMVDHKQVFNVLYNTFEINQKQILNFILK
jgi:hypothetical protein